MSEIDPAAVRAEIARREQDDEPCIFGNCITSSAPLNQWCNRCLLRAAGAAERGVWQPIETAPKDGTRVLLWNGYRRSYCWFNSYADGSSGWHRQNLLGEPMGMRDMDPDTHWQPLPAPPVGAPERTDT
jgi:hypothetical protein